MDFLVGSSATVRSALSELNGLPATIESFNPSNGAFTCSVDLPSGVQELIQLSKENLCDVVPPKVTKAPMHAVRVQNMTSTDYFFPEYANSRLESWWSAYQDAFKAEHAWLLERNVKTSSSAEHNADLMMELIFRGPTEPFRRQCYFAFSGDSKDACGFATVDVDPDPRKVCHLRMLMTDSAFQCQGIGGALLSHIESTFETRHIGLKFVNKHLPLPQQSHDHEHAHGGDGGDCGCCAHGDHKPEEANATHDHSHVEHRLVEEEPRQHSHNHSHSHDSGAVAVEMAKLHVVEKPEGGQAAAQKSLESFYGAAGFKRIGADVLYTYMAIKR